MKAYAGQKRRARCLVHAAIVLGTFGAAGIGTACSEEAKIDSDEKGIGLSTIEAVANSSDAANPMDATPSPDGKDVYFIAFATRPDEDGIKSEHVPAIFKAVRGSAPVKLFEGAPLGSPFGITISNDGATLFIADSGADTSDERSDGKVFTLAVAGGTPTPLAGTEGLVPAGVEVMGEFLYVTGRRDGQAGVFKIGIGGGAIAEVAVGGPFVDPGGVAVAHDGTVYVVDTGSGVGPLALAAVVRVGPNGTTDVIREGLAVGHPAGIALAANDTAVIVSALDPATANDRVYRIELADARVRELADTIGSFSESAGLHRARNAEVFAWADSHANQTGTVYVLSK